ncbi:unnamed protein product, partial [Heterosigma akashiwo]
HVKTCTQKARKLLAQLRVCVRPRWGLGRTVVQRLYKGAVEPMLLNGVAVWGVALQRKGVVRQLRSVQAMAAKAMTRCFKSTRTEVALALAGLPPVDLVGKEMVVLQYTHGTMRRRVEALREGCEWSPHLKFWAFERRMLDHELPYPPLRKAVKVTLGSQEAWAEELLEGARGGRIFTDGSKLEDGSVGAAFVAFNRKGREVERGLYRLPHYCTVYQAEGLAQRESARWTKGPGRDGEWMVASNSLTVLACLKSGRGMARLVSEIAREVEDRHSFVHIPGHQGHEGNEVADQLAKEAANTGIEVEVDVPRAFTRRLAKERTWRVWAQERRDLEHGSGMDMGEDKTYLRFAPMLEDIKEAVWKGGKAGGHRVLQLLSGHCNLAGYLHSWGKRDRAQCDICGRGEREDVEHYLLHCPRWAAQRQEM